MKFWSKRRSAHHAKTKTTADPVVCPEAALRAAVSREAVRIWLNNSPQQKTRLVQQLPGQRLVPSKSLPRLSVSSVSSEESWHRPNVRILHEVPGKALVETENNPLTRSIDRVFQGPLYKEIIYSSVNMNSDEYLNRKEEKEPAFKSTQSVHKQGKDISVLGSPSSVKAFPAKCLAQRVALPPKTETHRQSPVGSPEPTYTTVTRISKLDSKNCPMCRHESALPLAGVRVKRVPIAHQKTSTPKTRPVEQHVNKSVHFSSVVLSPIAPGSPPGYRPPPVGSCDEQRKFESLEDCRIVEESKKTSSSQSDQQSKTEDQNSSSFTDPTIVPDDSLLRQYLTFEVDSCLTKGTAVHHWLKDARLATEVECLSVLQGKSLTTDPAKMAALAVRGAHSSVVTLRTRIEGLMGDFKSALAALRLRPWAQFCVETTQLLADLQEVIQKYRSGFTLKLEMTKSEIRLKRASEDLSDFIERNRDHWVSEERRSSVKHTLKSMQECFKEVSELLLLQEMKTLVSALDNAEHEQALKVALAAVTDLVQSGDDLCQLLTKIGLVQSLLSICTDNKWSQLKSACLRALTILCCVPSAIILTEEAGGIDCIASVLCETSQDENVKSEAAGLLAQMTAPWMDCQPQDFRSLVQNLDPLVKALTHLAWKTDSSEVLLLSAAAMANLSFLDKEACHSLSRHDSPRVLVEACKSKMESIFIKDQVATVLANMAALDSCRSSLICGNAAVLLLCFLQVRPSPLHTPAELLACERLQQKAAIALARLCTETKMASTVAAMQGVKRLVRICKDEKERNNSDSVLVAALTALRKIASVCGLGEFKTLDAEDLVVPSVWESFRIYSSKHESYV